MASLIHFAGLDWRVKEPSQVHAPGPNHWSADHVWVDEQKRLHLKLASRDGRWYCAEVETVERLHFGSYCWRLVGYLDVLDPQVVVGMFSYPTPEVGPDGSNEIGIEIARFPHLLESQPEANLVYGAYPAKLQGCSRSERATSFSLAGTYSTHQFRWTRQRIDFHSWHGHEPAPLQEFGRYHHVPDDWESCLPHQPMPLHINLWLLDGRPPSDGQPVEIIVRDFTYEPAPPYELATLAENERRHILRVLEYTQGRVKGKGGAAEILGVAPSTLRTKIRRLGLEVPGRGGEAPPSASEI